MNKCIDCEHFKIDFPPIKNFDSGQARCEKYDLVVDYMSKRTLNNLECVEDDLK